MKLSYIVGVLKMGQKQTKRNTLLKPTLERVIYITDYYICKSKNYLKVFNLLTTTSRSTLNKKTFHKVTCVNMC